MKLMNRELMNNRNKKEKKNRDNMLNYYLAKNIQNRQTEEHMDKHHLIRLID